MSAPIAVDYTLVPDSTVASRQIYDALTGQYTPDYTLVPLTVRLSVSLTDPDLGPLGTPPSESELLDHVSGQWFTVEDTGERIPIDFTSGDFVLIPGEKHAFKVCRNVAADRGAMVLLFAGTYRDELGRQGYSEATLRVTSESESAPRPRISLNVPSAYEYNPLSDRSTVFEVAATLLQGGRAMTPGTDYKLVWQFLQPGQSAWRTCGDNEPDRAEFAVSAATDRLTMYLPMLVDGTRVRVRAAWRRPDGTWTGAAAANSAVIDGEDAAPEEEFTVVRRPYANMNPVIVSAAYLPETLDTVTPTMRLEGGKGVVDSAVVEAEMDITWRLGKATGIGSLTPLTAKTFAGPKATIPVADFMNPVYGGIIGVEVELKPPYGVATDADGNGYTDADGNYYIIR